MPLYEYRCEAGHVSIDLRKIDDRHAPHVCETCHAPAAFKPSVARTYMKADGFQKAMPSRPGFDNCDYKNRRWPAERAG